MYSKKLTRQSDYKRPTRILFWIALTWIFILPSSCSILSKNQNEFKNPFTIIVLPDTQNYADVRDKRTQKKWNIPDQRARFYEQTQWIHDNRKELNIKMVAHLGDIVQHDHPEEWEIADTAFQTIDHSVPYILSLGNHDMGCEIKPGTAHSRETKLNNYFPPSRFKDNILYKYGGNIANRSDNYYLTFEGAGINFIILSLEFKPRNETLEWAKKIISSHPNHQFIIVTHAYLMGNGKRFTNDDYDIEGNSGEEIWQKLVSQHKNIFMVLSGHTAPNSRLTSEGIHGNQVHQLLADFQFEKGGQGLLRIMKFIPLENRIDVSTYSPFLKEFKNDSLNKFSLKFNTYK
jgi:hypothetical protein